MVYSIHSINLIRKFAVNAIFFLIPLYFLELGYSGWQIGLITSCYAFSPLLFLFVAGTMTDRFPIRRVVQIGLFLQLLLFTVLGHIRSFGPMALCFFLLGGVNSSLDVSLNGIIFKSHDQKDLNHKFGVYSFWLGLGTALGTLMGGILISFTTFEKLFSVYTLILVLPLLFSADLPAIQTRIIAWEDYRTNFFNSKTLGFALLVFLQATHWGVEGTVYAPFLKSTFNLDNLQTSIFISIPLFFLAFASLSVSPMKFDPRANRNLYLSGMFMSGIGHAAMVVPSLPFSFFFRLIHETGDGLLGALTAVIISRMFRKESIGGSNGFLLTLMTLGHMAGAMVFSSIGHTYGLYIPFLLSGGILVLNTGLGFKLSKKY